MALRQGACAVRQVAGTCGALDGCVLRSPALGALKPQPDTCLQFQSKPPRDREKVSHVTPQLPKFHPPAHPCPLPGNTAPIPAPPFKLFRGTAFFKKH